MNLNLEDTTHAHVRLELQQQRRRRTVGEILRTLNARANLDCESKIFQGYRCNAIALERVRRRIDSLLYRY